MDFQQSHGHLPPPPPPSALPPPPQQQPPMTDMYHHHHQQQQQTLPGPPAPNPWYSTQFQYQHSSSPPPPQPSSYPPPPPPHQPWPQMLPQSHPDHYQSGPPPPPPPSYPTNPPYQAHHPQPQHNQYPPPPHQYPLPPLPPRHHNMPPPHQIPQNYPQVNQDWGNANWVHPQSWEYQANNNEEAWAAKARAWATAKVAPDSQPAPYIYAPIDGNVSGDSTAVYSGRDSSYNSLVHQQEVPSSYSSIAGDPVRGVEPAAAMPFGYTYVPPAEPGFTISSVPAVATFVPQVDPSAMLSSPLPTHSAPVFGRMPGPSFHATVSSVGPPFSVGAGPDMHTVTALSGDAYGVSGVSERPKKASVPNWLREEIIKNKPALVSSAAEPPREDTISNDDDGVYKSYGKNDMADSRSVDSSRSVEDDDDEDEDEVEAARTAAINKEIKRVLTEVLLKVTDELFDEIATKVLTEDDPSVEAKSTVTNSDDKVVPTTNGYGRVGVPDERKGTVFAATREKSAPSSTGDLLGLSSYVSDDDEDDERQSSEKLILNGNNFQQQVIKNLNFSEGTKAARDSDFLEETRKNPQTNTFAEPDPGSSIVSEAGEQRESRIESTAHDSQVHLKMESTASEQVVKEGKLKDNSVSMTVVKSEKSVDDIVSQNSTINDSLGQEKRVKSDKGYRHEDRRSSVDKDHKSKQLEGEKETASEKGYKTQNRHEERLDKTEKRSDQKVSRDRLEDKVVKSAEKTKDSDSKRRSPPDLSKELEKEKDKERANIRDDGGRKRERSRDVKRDESRHANGSSSGKHRRRRSSSVASRDRDNIDSLVVSHASDISNESSDYSKRKPHSRKQRSPSPATGKSRKRQVSRSPPHSKHSQHRHSSYSSLEASRRRRSRSRSKSPIRRRK